MAQIDEANCGGNALRQGVSVESMRFDRMPHTSRLFSDFLYDFERISSFYEDCGRQTSSVEKHALLVAGYHYEHRQRVCDALERINRDSGSSELALAHIRLLREPGSVAIVTGQQAGLFTGPLYTIYKALTAVKLAACLRDRGAKAVPVFWIASEDHDYHEVDHCKLIDTDGHLREMRYEPATHSDEVPVGNVRLCEGISSRIDELLAALPHSEFLPDIERDLRECYCPGTGFAQAFARLMARLLKNCGLILLDPMDAELRDCAGPMYVQALRQSGDIADALVDRSQALIKSGYHAQVHVSNDMAPLFIMDEGRRAAMAATNGGFHVKGSGKSFKKEELIELAERCSSCFSPNVTFRPVIQDYLLPTAAYIAGPAEVAYFAQTRAVYEVLGRPLPCIIPRSSMTLVEGRHQKTLVKHGLTLEDFFGGLHPAITKVVENSLDRAASQVFSEAESSINSQLDRLEETLGQSDTTLAASVKLAREKIAYQIEHLKTRFVHSSAKREETTYRQVERAYNTLYPDKNLQERVLNVFYFLSRYGPTLFDDLYHATDPGFSSHKIVHIGGAASQVVNAK